MFQTPWTRQNVPNAVDELSPSEKLRIRRVIDEGHRVSKIVATKMGPPSLGGRGACVRSSWTLTTAAARPQRPAKKKSSVAARAKAVAVCACLLSDGLTTVVVGFSAICSPPPRPPQEHKQQLSTPPSTTPQARQFLEDIISSQEEQQPSTTLERVRRRSKASKGGKKGTAAAAAAFSDEKEERDFEAPHNPTRADAHSQPRKAATQGLTDGSGAGAFDSLLEAAVAAPLVKHSMARFARDAKDKVGVDKSLIAGGLPRDADNTSDSVMLKNNAPSPMDYYEYDDPTSKRNKFFLNARHGRGKRAIHSMCADLCQARLLTRDEEYELGTKIQALMSYTAMRDRLSERLGRSPTPVEWAESCCMTVPELQDSLQVCRSAKEAMIRANMRMVISIARKYQNLGVPLADLIQEGSLGLVRAVEKFDPERGFKLSTYSAWWIQQAVFKGIAHQNRVIRLPMHVHNLLHSIRKARRDLKTNDGPEPTDSQVALHLDMPVKRLKRYMAVTKDTISFEMPTCAPEVSTKRRLLGDTLASGETKHPEKESDARLFRTRLRQMVQELPEDERTVVSLRFGLDNGKPKTLGQIADIVRTSMPYVRRVETTAMRKLRSPDYQTRLREFNFPAAAEDALATKE